MKRQVPDVAPEQEDDDEQFDWHEDETDHFPDAKEMVEPGEQRE